MGPSPALPDMKPAQRLKARLQQRDVVLGLLAIDHAWTDLVELSQRAGLDYLIVCMEHGPVDTQTVAEICATGRRLDFPVLIRPRSNDYATLRLAADLGPCGFLLASVETAAELDVVRDALYVPPRGRRRPGGVGNRWVSNFLGPTWQSEFEQEFLVLPQVETRKGLANRHELARHEVTTALALGPYDLSAELGVCGQMEAPILRDACRQVREAAEEAGKPGWLIGGDVAGMVREGWRFLCVGEPSWILVNALHQTTLVAREALAKPKS